MFGYIEAHVAAWVAAYGDQRREIPGFKTGAFMEKPQKPMTCLSDLKRDQLKMEYVNAMLENVKVKVFD